MTPDSTQFNSRYYHDNFTRNVSKRVQIRAELQ